MFVSVPGDLDGDGISGRFRVGFCGQWKAPGAGRVYIVSGKDGHRLFTLTGQTPARILVRANPLPAMWTRRASGSDRGRWQFSGEPIRADGLISIRADRRAAEGLHVPHSRRHFRVRRSGHGDIDGDWYGRSADHLGVERQFTLPFGPHLPDQ